MVKDIKSRGREKVRQEGERDIERKKWRQINRESDTKGKKWREPNRERGIGGEREREEHK